MTTTPSAPHDTDPEPSQPEPSRPRRRLGRGGFVALIVLGVLVVLAVLAAVLVPRLVGPPAPDDAAIARAFGGPGGATPSAPGGPAATPGGPAATPDGPADGPAGGRGPGGRGGPGGPGGPGGAGPLLDAVTHGEFVLDQSAGGRVVDVQRGEIVSVAPNAVIVRSADGFTATYGLEPGVRMTRDGDTATVSQFAAGDQARVVANRVGPGLVATVVTVD